MTGEPMGPCRSRGWNEAVLSVVDLDAAARLYQEVAGWVGHHDPVEYQFGPFAVIEVVATGHDGVVFSLVERLAPRLAPGQLMGRFTAPFNAPQIVSDIEQAREF